MKYLDVGPQHRTYRVVLPFALARVASRFIASVFRQAPNFTTLRPQDWNYPIRPALTVSIETMASNKASLIQIDSGVLTYYIILVTYYLIWYFI